ncbi:hypothetical protein BDV25DRAFT_138955 [Aspergillus avenaceus]|uniref:Cyanovirin-N domain-containing protein n=1 Tax=Aspergillus avenaceus TaxID=36643 RepID=A0A5N6TYC6_ASPAV|nr:hypothetical protein BDV25DRAFT_138955 [Aspergillus avenaceus]
MYQILVFLTIYLAGLAVAGNTNSKPPKTVNHRAVFEKQCSRVAIRLTPYTPRQHYLDALCMPEGKSSSVRPEWTNMLLDDCLGWDASNGGNFIAKKKGNGIRTGRCTKCEYRRDIELALNNFSCYCTNVDESEKRTRIPGTNKKAALREFHLDEAIRVDKDGKVHCVSLKTGPVPDTPPQLPEVPKQERFEID